MKNYLLITFGFIMVLTGSIVSAPVLLPQLFATPETSVSASPAPTRRIQDQTTPLVSGTPSHITFPSQNISVNVIAGYYNAKDNTWTLSKDKAQWAAITSEANNKTGNTFIYGHNRWQVFTGLLSAHVGDSAVVTTANNHTFTYTLMSIKDTDPHDLSYMQPTASPTLTVQTCSGIWYEHRRMLTYELTLVDGKEQK